MYQAKCELCPAEFKASTLPQTVDLLVAHMKEHHQAWLAHQFESWLAGAYLKSISAALEED